MSRRAISEAGDAVLDEAIEWMVCMAGGHATSAEREAFEAWHAARPEHASVYARLTRSVRHFEVARKLMPPDHGPVHRVLERPVDRRKALARLASVGVVAVTAVGVASQLPPLGSLVADLKTATGERHAFTLADGSVATLNACSAVDVSGGAEPVLHLLAGELLMDASASHARGVSVVTPHGRVAAAHASFSVQLLAKATDIAVRSDTVMVHGLAGEGARLAAGERVRLDGVGLSDVRTTDGSEFAWVRGYYEALDRPLGEVIDALRPYRAGFIRTGPGVAGLSVTGAFPLDDTWRALSALAAALPISVRQFSPYLVSITRR